MTRSRRPGSVHISAPSFPAMPRPSVYRKIAYTFLALTVVVVLAVLWLTSVRAEVLVKVRREPIKLDGTVQVAKNPEPGQIKGRVVQGTFEKIQEFQVSEPTAVVPAPVPEPGRLPDDKVVACGEVRVVNTYSRAQPLVERTRLLTADNKLYRITQSINVPAKGEVKVRACADKPGYAYVIGPTRFTIPGLFIDLQAFIYAVSDAPMVATPIENTPLANAPAQPTTPTPAIPTTPVKRVTATDLENAERTLTDIVLARAKSDLSTEAGNPVDHEVVYVTKILDKKSNVTVGQAAETFLYSVKLEVTAVYYPKEDMQLLVRNRLRERVPDGREFVPVEGGAVTYSLESADKATEVATIRITADGAYRLGASSPLLQPSVIAGKSKDEAIAILKAVEGVEDVQITIRPNWLSTVPALKDKVHITVE